MTKPRQLSRNAESNPVSVLLDTYLGVIRGDEAVAMARFEALQNPTPTKAKW